MRKSKRLELQRKRDKTRQDATAVVKPERPEWSTRANARTASVYFQTLADLDLVKRAADAEGIAFTTFIRTAALGKANDVMGRAS